MNKLANRASVVLFLAGVVGWVAYAAPQSPGLAAQPQQGSAAPFDLLIQNGRIIDGTGNPAVRADVGVRGDRIVAVGNLGGAAASRVIDARGLVVAPGFIDLHTHADDSDEKTGLRHSRSGAPRRAVPSTGPFVTPAAAWRLVPAAWLVSSVWALRKPISYGPTLPVSLPPARICNGSPRSDNPMRRL